MAKHLPTGARYRKPKLSELTIRAPIPDDGYIKSCATEKRCISVANVNGGRGASGPEAVGQSFRPNAVRYPRAHNPSRLSTLRHLLTQKNDGEAHSWEN